MDVMEDAVSVLADKLQQLLPIAELVPLPLPQAPEISLYLLAENYPTGPLDHEASNALMSAPPYWSFCWGSGHAFARFILDRPGYVAGKRVLDFGAGSGIAGIAAMLAGAEEVICCDLDQDAILACESNSQLNNVDVTLLDDYFKFEGEVDVIIATDVLYDRENYVLLKDFLSKAKLVLIADSRVKQFNFPGYSKATEVEVLTFPDLGESDEFKNVSIYKGSQSNVSS